ncbi:MAG: PIN domain-containing protein [Patescibacteria group bacterium]
MYLIDSSVWIALFLDDDSQHAKAVDVLRDIGEATIKIPYGVILETTTTLSRKQSKEQADKFVEYIRSNSQIEITPPFVSEDLSIFLAESDRLSFVDALLKGASLRDGLTLISFDKQLLNSLKRAGGSPV